MFGLGMGEIVLVGTIAFLFLGPKKIPELAKGLGEGIGTFKKALQNQQEN
jgi:TatA/E family protein of Tat protein translocase